MKDLIEITNLYLHPTDTNLALLVLFWVLVVGGETFRRAPLTESLNFWVVFPPLLFPIWVQYWNAWDWFLWAKTITLIPIAVIWCSNVRLGLVNDDWTQWGTFIVLSINILEAVAKDALSKEGRATWNQLNALSGIFLILNELPTLHTARISSDDMSDFLWKQGPCWIFGKHFIHAYSSSTHAT